MTRPDFPGIGGAAKIAVNANVPASTLVFEELRARIVSLKLPPGTILNRADLAEAFGVSQSPIREAIQRLEEIDLVMSYRQSRTEVTRINRERLRYESFLRCGMECEVVDRLCRAPGADLTKAMGYLKMQEVLAGDTDQIELFRELDENFHEELFAAAGYEAIHRLVIAQSSQMARLRTLDLPRGDKMHSVVEGHRAVIDCITAGDRQGAADAMRVHLSGTIGRLDDIMQANDGYFT
ncbi:GntR family transcriptional regulator [Psychromarinibacter halotolerans]|uniref:GntR family transcriptional regulator n=1 Tax=Psychromarinibacter halotolerans TaxID=1775175 RepID=A0ABV7GWD7_9RHOB|nr:GntR family transcriptional regulator [Psychromarinibacter halotolerans]MDF0597594.1 GntR family transcriptional regulator [Psychromarinibacter halotolerans]